MELYRALTDLSCFACGDHEFLVYSPISRQAITVDGASLSLLQHCTEPATLNQHAERLVEKLKLPREQALNALQMLVHKEILFSCSGLLQLLKGYPREEMKPPNISSLAVPTRNRPDGLSHCLSGYLEHAQKHERKLDIVISDASAAGQVQAKNQSQLQELTERFQAQIYYAGPAQKEAFVQQLSKRGGFDAEMVRFALFGDEHLPVTTGSNRNALLLSTVDELTAQVDDDILCQLVECPQQRPGIALVSQGDPTEWWFSAEEQRSKSAGSVEADLFSWHERFLGKSLHSCLADLPPDLVYFDHLNSSFVRRLYPQGGKVMVSLLGVSGDAGMSSSAFLLTLTGQSRQRLVLTEKGYRNALNLRQVLHVAPTATISEGSMCMAGAMATDNRQLLPPFMPVQRNEDAVFGALYYFCIQGGLMAYQPLALQHKPVQSEGHRQDYWQNKASEISFNDIVCMLFTPLQSNLNDAGSPQNLKLLGAALDNLGSSSISSFEDMVREAYWNSTSMQIYYLQTQLETGKELPDYWRRDVESRVQWLKEGLTRKESYSPCDLIEPHGADGALPAAQQLIRRFGRLLQIWPDLWQTTRDLKSNGIRLGTSLNS